MSWYAPYVSVAKRKKQAESMVLELKKKGQIVQPVWLEGRTIAKTFWGKAWCSHLESYSDYDNRLPRGRTYVRNGSIVDLQIHPGEIKALVRGSSMYRVHITIIECAKQKWEKIATTCSGKIDSLIELLQGQLSSGIMDVMIHKEGGLLPSPKEIKLSCSCPDWAEMCKHVAAVLYGVGARLDEKPQDLFLLRQVDPAELMIVATKAPLTQTMSVAEDTFSNDDLSALFGIDIDQTIPAQIEAIPSAKRIKSSAKTSPQSSVKAKTISKTVKPNLKKSTPSKTTSKKESALTRATLKPVKKTQKEKSVPPRKKAQVKGMKTDPKKTAPAKPKAVVQTIPKTSENSGFNSSSESHLEPKFGS